MMPRTPAAAPTLFTATLPRTGAVLARRVLVATGAASMRGLLGRDCMAPGEGLYFPSATFGALHSIGMRFAFDALYLDRHGVVRRVLRGVPPGRLCPWDLWTAAALELPVGAAADVRRGDAVWVGPASADTAPEAAAPAP
jgi:uncharacterized membrane protein (UPF0127 family)